MKTLVTILFLTISSFGFSQTVNSKNEKVNEKHVKINSLTFTVDSTEELKNINWDDIKEVFSMNSKNQTVEFSVALEPKNAKNNFKSSITVSGETKNLDSIIERAKKGVKSLIKISKNYKS